MKRRMRIVPEGRPAPRGRSATRGGTSSVLSAFTRRDFLRGIAAAGGAAVLPPGATGCGSENAGRSRGLDGPLVLVSIDALHPEYLNLTSDGRRGGSSGDWLMPNLSRFLGGATRFDGARCYLPAATDMNHLNALAGTSSAETGVMGVSIQFVNWNPDGSSRLEAPHMSWVRDGGGRPVDTLFQAWKRKWPESRTAFVSGKFWVADMYRSDSSGIDLFVTGNDHPDWIPPAAARSFYDPPEDEDRQCDSESVEQQVFQAAIFDRDPAAFPPDAWVVDASLAVLERESPDVLFVLLAQGDDAQHALGTAWDPDEFENRIIPYTPPPGCTDPGSEDWQLVSKRNIRVFREAVLDTMRDIDAQFGRLIDGLKGIGKYDGATIVLYSDHSQINHLLQRDWLPIDYNANTTDMTRILHEAGVITDEEKDGIGYFAFTATSLGEIYFKADSMEERRQRARAAKETLLRHTVLNIETLRTECPWDVLDHDDMRNGMPGVADPGELWHEYFGPRNDGESVLWPDLVVLLKNGWQAPAYQGLITNIGIQIPLPLPPLTIVLGGHGAPDSQPIVMAMSGPGVARGRVLSDPGYERDYRVADIAATVAERFGLELTSAVVGRDRSGELKP